LTHTVLISGGAGFIGTHLARALQGRVNRIVILDSLLPQIHGQHDEFPEDLQSMADCHLGDVRDLKTWYQLGERYPDISTVVHLAALTGTGQSMYAVKEYDSVNCGGTATMLEALLGRQNGRSAFPRLNRVVLASSRAIYGEGAYSCRCSPATLRYPVQRSADQLARGEWNFHCPDCEQCLSPVRTTEAAPAQPTSFYGVTKLVQEQYTRTMLTSAGVGYTILRFQNVFGPGQSLKNPYTGVIGVFYSNIVRGLPIDVYEDGEVTRDFVYVSDVASSIQKAILSDVSGTFNIGTGEFTRLKDIALWLCEALGREVPIGCKGAFRVGDIRHNAAELRHAMEGLAYSPAVSVRDGLRHYAEWASMQTPLEETAIVAAAEEIQAAGLARG
jgi:dTDP-L-rhamnose 4-epimerase